MNDTLTIRSSDDLIVAAYNGIKLAFLRELVHVLETGDNIGSVTQFSGGVSAKQVDDVRDRLRALRDDLIELELYRLYIGQLPEELRVQRTVGFRENVDPWADPTHLPAHV